MTKKTLRKRSATNASRREKYKTLARPVIFIDRAIQGQYLIDALKEAGANIQLHRDHFLEDCPDIEWLPKVGAKGWCVLTKDEQIRHNPLEKRVMSNACIGFFVFTSKKATGPEIAEIVVKHLERIETIAEEANKPFVVYVNKSGVVIKEEA